MKKFILFFLGAFSIIACDNLEYSPNQLFDRDTPRNLNQKNLDRIARLVPDDTVTIAFVGDSQRFYDEVEDFVDKVNQFDNVDFVLLAGDITDFGLLAEYEWIVESFNNLRMPFIGVVGNHDVIANGEGVYNKIFGPMDFSFVYDSIKFVVHNTNSREYYGERVPDVEWLRDEMKSEADSPFKNIIGVSHVPPTDGDFNPKLVQPYADLLASTQGFLVSLHGHIHSHKDHYPFNDGVRYITSYAFSQRNFLMLKIVDGEIIKEEIPY